MYLSFSNYNLTNSLIGLIFAHSILAIPVVFVTLPIIRTTIFASGLFAFVTSLDEVVVSIFIAGSTSKTLPVVMWENMRTQVDPTIAVASTILIVGMVG
ncbi:MAG: hypothetical protein WD469_09700 [Paenibacillaceae bacterium]